MNGRRGCERVSAGRPSKALTVVVAVCRLLPRLLCAADDPDLASLRGRAVCAQVAPLPRSPCVAELLSGYVQQALAKAAKCDVEEEVAAGLTSYFDRACVGRLLYMPEWPQAEALLSGKRRRLDAPRLSFGYTSLWTPKPLKL